MDHQWITVIALPSCIRRRGSEWGSYAYHLSNLNSLVVRILDLGPLNLRTETQTETETGNQQKQTQTQELQTIIQEKKCTDMQWCEYYIAVCDHVTVIGMWPLSILEFMVTICGAPFWNGCGKNDCFCFWPMNERIYDASLFSQVVLCVVGLVQRLRNYLLGDGFPERRIKSILRRVDRKETDCNYNAAKKVHFEVWIKY